jgi:general secretion pathway protein D
VDTDTAADSAAPEQPPAEEMVYLNVQDGDIRDIIKQVSKATGRNFIIDDKLRGRKLTILSERKMTKGELFQTFLSALNVAGYTVVEGPGGVFKVVGLQEAKKHPIPTHVDTIPISDAFITRLITLTNVGAADMMRAIRDMISRGGGVQVYLPTNTLILTDSGSNIDRLMKIIKELDQEGPQQVMEVIPVHFASAKEVANMVNQLFQQQKSGKSANKPGEPVDLDEVSKMIPDDRINSIVVLASKRAMLQVREIIRKLDRRLTGDQEGRIHVYYLKHAQAKEMATTLSSLTQGAGKAKAGAAAAVLADFGGEIKITADESTNSLIITASFKDYKTLISRVVSKLDVRRPQVYLEAAIMELRITNDRSYGTSGHGGFGGSLLGFGQTFGAIQGLQGSVLSGPTSGPALLGGIISQSTVNINTVNPATGDSKAVSIPAFSAFLQALSTYGDVNIISTPNLLTLDNEEASINVEREVPIPGPQTIGAAAVASITPVTYETAGLKLKIKPQIGFGETITLKIEQELSTFGERDPVLNAPTKVKRNVSTNVLCKDGQTVVIGGLMEDQIENTKRKIPILGDIPLLGFFFSQTSKRTNKSNLLIFLTPHIVKDSTDFQEILQRKVSERNKFVEHNYGKRQQEIIRASIKSHRKDLLEFKDGQLTPAPMRTPTPGMLLPPQATPPQAGLQTIPMTPVITAPPISLAPAKGGKAPVWVPSASSAPSSGVSSTTQPIIEESVISSATTPAPSAPATDIPPTSSVTDDVRWKKTLKKQAESAAAKATSAGTIAPLVPEPTITIPPAPGSRKNGLKLGY